VASRPTAGQAPTPPRTWAGQGPHHHGKTTLHENSSHVVRRRCVRPTEAQRRRE